MARQDQQVEAMAMLQQGASDEAVERATALPLERILGLRAWLATAPRRLQPGGTVDRPR